MADDKKTDSKALEQETLLEFPCTYEVKVIGLDIDAFDKLVFEIVSNHIVDLEMSAVRSRNSNGGKYLSVTVSITATSKQQLDNIYIELSGHDRVKMAL